MRRLLIVAALLLVLAACSYQPAYEGTRCGPDDSCPAGFICVPGEEGGICTATPPGDDGEPTGADDGGQPDDARLDGSDQAGETDGNNCQQPDADGDGHLALACGGDDCDDSRADVYLGASELCDGVDNDCDGLTDSADDGLRPALCHLQVGVCAGALSSAQDCRDGAWVPCDSDDYLANSPAYEVEENSCDGLDNDCDGRADEELTGPDCPLQQGVCAGSHLACLGADGWAEACGSADYGPDYQQQESSCDGLDNDCDGLTDSDDPDLEIPSCEKQQGVCNGASKLPSHCQGGIWQACGPDDYLAHDDAYEQEESSCDGRDNDCDGSIDEGCAGCTDGATQPCPLQQGVCAGSQSICQDEQWLPCDYSAHSQGSYQLPPETACDGLDNDCDGITDGMQRPCREHHQGICAVGSETCTGPDTWTGCPQPELEECNGIDDDCDGLVDATDSDLVLAPCEHDTGVCAGQHLHGADKCQDGSWAFCDQAEYGSDFGPETCGDGLDNDCDGITDCGPPECDGASQPCQNDCLAGQRLCQQGAWGPCLPEPGPEGEQFQNCGDDLDNDCDGVSDCAVASCDGVSRVCFISCHQGSQSCSGGTWTSCDAEPLVDERPRNGNCSDGVDNDCDGKTDSDEDLCCQTAGTAGSLLLILLWPLGLRRKLARLVELTGESEQTR